MDRPKLGGIVWVAVDEDGEVLGHEEGDLIDTDEHTVRHEVDLLRMRGRVTPGDKVRIVRVRLVEVN